MPPNLFIFTWPTVPFREFMFFFIEEETSAVKEKKISSPFSPSFSKAD